MASLEDKIQQLIDMGASRAQARRAFQRNTEVMEAAQEFFDGKYDDVKDNDDVMEDPQASSSMKRPSRLETPPDDDDDDVEEEEELEDDGEVEDFADYDSDTEFQAQPATGAGSGVDPYAGIFFSKDRREEVIEVEETPEFVTLLDGAKVPLMTQGEWMKGCPEGGEQGLLFQLYSKLSGETLTCPSGCGASIVTDKALFFAIWPKFPDYVNNLRRSIEYTCSTCKTKFCRACGERIDPQKASKPNYDPLLHCPDLQGVILGMGLAMLEHLYTQEPMADDDQTSKKRKSTPSPSIDDDDDYALTSRGSKKAKGGVGYAGNQREDTTGQTEALRAQQERDGEIGALMSQIRIFLPSLRRQGGPQTSDYLVHPTALAHLRRRFNLVGSSLLRNDSLADMSDRDVVYFELFEWFEIISNHEALASMMGMPIMIIASVSALKPQGGATKNRGPAPRERTIVYEGSSGPRELMESIVIQAQAAIKGLGPSHAELAKGKVPTEAEKRRVVGAAVIDDVKGKAKATTAEENAKLRNFCERIVATAEAVDRSLRETKGDAFIKRLHNSLPKVSTASSASTQPSDPKATTSAYDDVPVGTTEAETRAHYVKWAQQIRFEYCDLSLPPAETPKNIPKPNDDGPPHYRHAYNSDIRMLANSDIPKRSLAIAKELATLTTNLPVAWGSSVFLRVDETRVDVIKALIIGPDGTPYENGCFVFDIFLGPNYNQSPPSVKYMTTNGGKYRFNPNLYADGKVCLSLLGTWQGPGWVAGKSTLLQVLISIQSMILNEEPYLNEPGWAGMAGTAQSKAYSANVRRMVIHAAMLGVLQDPPPPFADIIRTHFRLKAKALTAQLDRWLREDDGTPTNRNNSGGVVTVSGAAAAVAGVSRNNGMTKHVDEIKAILGKLTANGVTAAKGASSSAMETD